MEWNAKVAKLVKELAPPGAKSILLRITGAAEAQKEARAESVRQASAPLLAKIAAGRARTEAREKELARVVGIIDRNKAYYDRSTGKEPEPRVESWISRRRAG